MKWNKFTIRTTTAAEDFLSAMLDELGIEGIEIENNIPLGETDMAKMFIDFMPETRPDDGISHVSFYLEDGRDHSALLRQVMDGIEWQRQFVDVGEGTITSSETEDIDWLNNWKAYFHAFSIENILIKPTWEDLEEKDADKILIEIDPGISFGTGKHETTQLCIRQLRRHMAAGARVLDVGTGSGILGITALKLGAGSVFGTDLDENAITAVGENLEANGIGSGSFQVLQGNIIDDKEIQDRIGYACYDIAVANILAGVIIMLQREIPVHLKKNGIFIMSGILNIKEKAVKEALEQNPAMEILETDSQGEWISITARKR